MINPADAHTAIKEINFEKHQLERNNDVLAEKIATTHALQAYHQKLKEHNKALRLSGFSDIKVDQNDIDNMYDTEIVRLKEVLETCQKRERVLDYEYNQVEADYQKSKEQLHDSEEHVKQLKISSEIARKDADRAVAELNTLTQECEELRGVLEFNSDVHKAELDNLRIVLQGQPSTEYLPDYSTNVARIDIQKVLVDFRREYQEILERAYEQERQDLLDEVKRLEAKLRELEIHLANQQRKRDSYHSDIESLKRELQILEMEATKYKRLGDDEQRRYEQEREALLKKIQDLEESKRRLEKELAILIDEDNAAVKLIIQLQLEINAYRALMEAEEDIYADHLEIPLSDITRRSLSLNLGDDI